MHKGTHRRFPRSAMQPLKITAWLQCGVISDPSLPLDSLLYYQAMRERYGEQGITWSGAEHPNSVVGITLPLMRCNEEGPMWFYAASWAQWPESVADGQDHWNKRLDLSLVDLIDFHGRRGTVDPGCGSYKAYHMPVFYRHAVFVSWYVLGVRRSVENLLQYCTHLGKKASQGWGSVQRWSIEPCAEDWSVRDGSGRLMRAVPADRGILVGYRPSYWMPKNQAVCEVPA